MISALAYAVDLFPRSRKKRRPSRLPLDFTLSIANKNVGYIAGIADGIVTVQGKAAKREIWCMDVSGHVWVRRLWSDDNGHYMITGLDPDKRYLVMARDYNKEFEPFAYDHVKPATDLTTDGQRALRESWTK
ncbi:hypothetical protein ACTXGO_00790 [Psychrobacter sp. T6-1]|uniref:hypothetical protein n=1 Tax=Psychrobacter sp. T6-1 TaxID=3457447 RepID=UPI003FD4C91C